MGTSAAEPVFHPRIIVEINYQKRVFSRDGKEMERMDDAPGYKRKLGISFKRPVQPGFPYFKFLGKINAVATVC
jgi:hypothetical protein